MLRHHDAEEFGRMSLKAVRWLCFGLLAATLGLVAGAYLLGRAAGQSHAELLFQKTLYTRISN